MRELNFATGLEEFRLNDKCTVVFNPTDPTFAERLYNTFSDLDKRQEIDRERMERATDHAEMFQIGRDMDMDMRHKINDLFGEDICTPLIGTVNIYALADGMPIWANLLLTIMDEMDSSYAREQKATNPRIKNYTEKYRKYMKK